MMSTTSKFTAALRARPVGLSSLVAFILLALASPVRAQWQPDQGLVISGTVVTMNDASDVLPAARVFLRDGRILAVARQGEDLPPAAVNAVVVTTEGFIYPGMIDLHNHPEYNVFPLWVVPERFRDRYQWRGRKAYKAAVAEPYKMLSKKAYLNLQAELGKYAELKAIVGGTTAIQGMSAAKAYSSVEFLVRNVEYTQVGAKEVHDQIDPARNEQKWAEFKRQADKSGAWLFHLAEGLSTSPSTGKEFALLKSHGLVLPQLVAIHCVGVTTADLQELGTVQAKMVWSPFSNLLLYGQTADVKAAKDARMLISLAPDWSPSGSKSVLGELKIADVVNRTQLNTLFSDDEIVAMATRNPAVALGWGAIAGQVAPGFLGDVVVMDRLAAKPFRSLIRATEANVQLVVIRGEPLYGDATVLRGLKTYREPLPNGSTRLRRQYELLKPVLPGEREKAVDFKRAGVEKGNLSVKDLTESLTRAMQFDRTTLRKRISPAQVAQDLATCKKEPPPATPPTADDFKRFLRCTFPGGLAATPLDPLFTVTDDEFFRRLDANANLPPEIRGIRNFYRTP
jgi:5-methylthioadenosine/S-adenosylhomocysteine deaminase